MTVSGQVSECDAIVREILSHHGIQGGWQSLPATGLANRIYATSNVVLRIATDHPEAVEDARTESVAAPIAHAAGVLTPRLLVFDDSRTLVDRPYSLWERVHGHTLGLLTESERMRPQTWSDVGRQLSLLHSRVEECPDPLGWLDKPGRDLDLAERVEELALIGAIDSEQTRQLQNWIATLRPAVATKVRERFIHNDVHEMNLMCSEKSGSLIALLDWGDAGWGDPALELAQIPWPVLRFVLDAYEEAAPGFLGEGAESRIIWDHLAYSMERMPTDARAFDDMYRFVRTADARWRMTV
ncbi:MAG: aminoglycoside phosphotransferase family protein [Acidobacteria bacterium]|nr:aminoglycoside phosphotransferase family protein [Acidobacteriota bacterium]